MPHKDLEKRKEYFKKYNQTMKYKLYNWKRQGIKIYNEKELYDKYMILENCELCDCELDKGNTRSNRKTLDHDHFSGYVRFICCNTCNNSNQKKDNQRVKLNLEIHRFFKNK